MTTRYQSEHYEDVARILAREPIGGTPSPVQNIILDFADLFAADNPPTCRVQHHVGPGIFDFAICHARPGDTSANHNFKGGFDRAAFLEACGLKEQS